MVPMVTRNQSRRQPTKVLEFVKLILATLKGRNQQFKMKSKVSKCASRAEVEFERHVVSQS